MSERELAERLKRAVSCGDVITVRRLIKGGVDTNTLLSANLGNVGGSLLHEAVSGSKNEIVDILLQAKCDINIKDKAGNTPLHLACRRGNHTVAKALVNHRAHVNTVTKGGRSPLHVSVWWGHEGISFTLLKSGASVNLKDDDGWTCLHSACSRKSSLSLVERVIQSGADLNVTDKTEMTPLHRCVQNSTVDFDTLKLLLKSGADPNINRKAVIQVLVNPTNPRQNPACRSLRVMRILLAGGYHPHGNNLAGLEKTLVKLTSRSDSDKLELSELLQDCKASVPRLCHLGRCRVRSILNKTHGGRAIKRYVNALPIPELLKEYLVYADELDTT